MAGHTDAVRRAAIAAYQLYGSYSAAERASGASRKTIKRWVSESPAEEREQVAEEIADSAVPTIERIVSRWLHRLEVEGDSINVGQLAVPVGIMIDKLRQLKAQDPAQLADLSRTPADIAGEIESILKNAHVDAVPVPDESEAE